MIPFQLLSRQVFCCCPRVTGFLGSLLQVQPSRIGWILGRQSLEGRGPEPRRGRGVPTVCSRKPHCLLLALTGNLWILDFYDANCELSVHNDSSESAHVFQTMVCDALLQSDDADSFKGSIVFSRRAPVWTVSLQTGSEGLGNPIKETLHVRDF